MFDDESDLNEYQIEEFLFKKYTDFCPEQWYIYHKEEIIGYIRTRWGNVRVDYYKTGFDDYEEDFARDKVEVLIETTTDGFGCFDTYEERIGLFNQVATILEEKIK